jgi:GT2 family glycosyltransferase
VPPLAQLPPARPRPGAPDLSVVIPTVDRFDALVDTLAALDAQACDPEQVEVVVVDNAHDGATASRLTERDGRLPLRVVREPTPGPAAARNAGIRQAAAPVVLLLGDDMRPAVVELLERHLALHAADTRPAFAVLGRVTWRPDKPITPFMDWLEQGGAQFDFDALQPGRIPAARSFYTSHVSVKVAALEAVGGFDERFPFAAVEDVEIGLRLQEAGLELSYHPELLVHHDHGYRPRDFAVRQARVGASARLMHELHGSRGLLPEPRWTWALHRAARPLLEALAVRPLRPRIRARVWAALAMSGYARGWVQASDLLERGREPS